MHLREQDWLTTLFKFTGELKQKLNLLYFRHQYCQHPASPSPHYIESVDSSNWVAILAFANAILRQFSALKVKTNDGKLEKRVKYIKIVAKRQ